MLDGPSADAATSDVPLGGSEIDAAVPADPCAALQAEAQVGGWRVQVASATWRLTPPGASTPTLSGPTGCVPADPAVESASGAPRVESNFGAFKVSLEGAGAEMQWRPATGPQVEVTPEGAVQVRAESGEVLRFEADAARPDHLWLRVEAAPAAGTPPTGVGLRLVCAEGESFFGLGTQSVDLDLRGRVYPLWTQEQGIGKPEDGLGFPLRNVPEAAYAPMGVWQSLRVEGEAPVGYAAVLERDEFALLDLCKTEPTRVRLRTLNPTAGLLLVPGDSPRERLSAVTAEVGRLPEAPPEWVLAPWNDSVGGPERLRGVAETLRREGVPSSAMWSEDWIGGEEAGFGYRLSYAWAWDPTRYPDLAGDVAWLHDRGFAFLAYFNPFVPETTAMFAEGLAGDFLIEDAEGSVLTFLDPAFRPASLVDLSHPPAVAWLSSYLERAAAPVEAGGLDIDGWMADFAEWLPVQARLRNGETGWAAHNRYPLLWQSVNREVMDRVRGPGRWVYFARSGWASANGGTSGLAPTVWGGDQNTNWLYDDGLPTVVPIGAHVGFGGVAIFGSDVGGYTSVMIPPTTKSLFFRWTTLAAFTPLMRTHHGSTECRNWSFDRDADTLAHFKRYASVHTRLYPYLRGLVDEALSTGWPLLRHPALVEPGAPNLWAQRERGFFLGDDVFVSPVVDEGAVDWPVTLPPGGWWPLFGGAVVAGGGDQVFETGLTEVPVFVRAGTALPLLTDTPVTFYPLGASAEPGLAGLEAARTRLTIALYPDETGAVRSRTLDGVFGPETTAPEVRAEGLPAEGEVSLVGPGQADLGATGRVTVVGGPVDVTYTFTVGATAWGPLRDATPVGELNPDIPPPCEVEGGE